MVMPMVWSLMETPELSLQREAYAREGLPTLKTPLSYSALMKLQWSLGNTVNRSRGFSY